MKFYSDKQELLRLANIQSYPISNFSEKESSIEKVHNYFCKRSLNMSKYASNTAIQEELGRYPIYNIAKGFVIKYWLRLNSGTKNVILNEAYQVCLHDQHDWSQSVQYLLCENGFRHVWVNPNSVKKDSFHKYFKQRLNDQHLQNLNSRINPSSRFTTLRRIHKEYKLQNYIEKNQRSQYSTDVYKITN